MILKKKVLSSTANTTKVTPNTRKNQCLDTNGNTLNTTSNTTKKGVVIEDVSHRTHSGDSMRGLFYITKGRYKKCGNTFLNTISGDVSYIGGYDPSVDTTERWYTLRDYETHHCVSCGSDLEKVLQGVYTLIKRYRGSAKKYFKHVSEVTSDDIYEVRYLGHKPLTHDQRVKKAEGRCPRISLSDKVLYDCVYQEYGHYYGDELERWEEKAYEDLERIGNKNRLVNKAKRLMTTM